MSQKRVFITGGTGYLGQRLIPELLRRGHEVRALVREGSEAKLPDGCTAVVGNALDKETFAAQVAPSEVFVQLVGVPRPSPAKARQFREIDLVSVRASVPAAVEA
ncbi:MAG: NAD(P)H-binding protein, partial [Acidobacteria bacterium]|nr:NAD(P)H-binding protein [Acidobacteriota bacterium]